MPKSPDRNEVVEVSVASAKLAKIGADLNRAHLERQDALVKANREIDTYLARYPPEERLNVHGRNLHANLEQLARDSYYGLIDAMDDVDADERAAYQMAHMQKVIRSDPWGAVRQWHFGALDVARAWQKNVAARVADRATNLAATGLRFPVMVGVGAKAPNREGFVKLTEAISEQLRQLDKGIELLAEEFEKAKQELTATASRQNEGDLPTAG